MGIADILKNGIDKVNNFCNDIKNTKSLSIRLYNDDKSIDIGTTFSFNDKPSNLIKIIDQEKFNLNIK